MEPTGEVDPTADADGHLDPGESADPGAFGDVAGDLPDAPDQGSAEVDAEAAEPTTTLTDERLVELRAAIDGVTELPVGDRLAVFERVNADLASELAALDEL